MKGSLAASGLLFAAVAALLRPAWAATTVQSASMEVAMDDKAEQVLKTIDLPLRVRAGVTTTTLLTAAEAHDLAKRLRAQTALTVYLVIDRLRVHRDPAALLRLQLAGSAQRGRTLAPETVGDFNVFGLSHAEGGTALRSFEVTGVLRKLAPAGAVSLRVVVGADAARDAEVDIGKISLLLRPRD